MLNKEEFAKIIERLMNEYEKHQKESDEELLKISAELSKIDKELEFANLINDNDAILEIKERIEAFESRKKEIVAASLLYEQKLKQFKKMIIDYAQKRIERALEEEIDLEKTQTLNILEVNASALKEEISKCEEQFSKLESAKEVDLASTEEVELKNKIKEIKQNYMFGIATDEDVIKAKELTERVKEIRTNAEKRALEQEKAINSQQEEIRDKMHGTEKDLKKVEEKMNELSEISLEEYRKNLIDEIASKGEKQKENLNDPYTVSKRNAFLRLASDKKIRYKVESCLRKYHKYNNYNHFVVSVSGNYLSYVNDNEKSKGYEVDLIDAKKCQELNIQLKKDMSNFLKIEELRNMMISTLPNLAWAKENGWLEIPLNLAFYEQSEILGEHFVPSSILKAKSLNLSELLRKLIKENDVKYKIENLKKEIEADLWKELGIFFANRISATYLNHRRIWPSKVQNASTLEKEINSILRKNSIYMEEAQKMLDDIDSYIQNSNHEREEQEKIEKEIASALNISPEIVKELIIRKELTEENIERENFAIHSQNNEEENRKENIEDEYVDYLDDLEPDELSRYELDSLKEYKEE